jgi:hypothetical protein
MSTSEQHTDVNRRDPLGDQPETVDDRYGTGEQHVDAGGRDRTEVDPMLDRTAEPRDTGLTTDELLSDDTRRTEPGPTGTRDDTTRDDTTRDDTTRDDTTASRSNGSTDDLRGDADATAGTASATTGVGSGSSSGGDSTGDRAPLVSRDRADQYTSRWNEVKGMFVDEPRQAVQQADALVGDLLDDLEQLFRAQRQEIENGLDNDDTSTEDLRMALRRYRSFFDRLLAV